MKINERECGQARDAEKDDSLVSVISLPFDQCFVIIGKKLREATPERVEVYE